MAEPWFHFVSQPECLHTQRRHKTKTNHRTTLSDVRFLRTLNKIQSHHKPSLEHVRGQSTDRRAVYHRLRAEPPHSSSTGPTQSLTWQAGLASAGWLLRRRLARAWESVPLSHQTSPSRMFSKLRLAWARTQGQRSSPLPLRGRRAWTEGRGVQLPGTETGQSVQYVHCTPCPDLRTLHLVPAGRRCPHPAELGHLPPRRT